MVIVLAVSRELLVFLVDDMWTSTMGRGSVMWTHVYKKEEVKNPIFLWTS